MASLEHLGLPGMASDLFFWCPRVHNQCACLLPSLFSLESLAYQGQVAAE